MQNKAPQLVLLLGQESLLRDGLTSLLTDEPDFQIEIMSFSELDSTLGDLKSGDARIYLVCEANHGDQLRTMQLLRDILPRELFRVVVIRHDDRMVDVYRKQRLPINSFEDLIAILEPELIELPNEGQSAHSQIM